MPPFRAKQIVTDFNQRKGITHLLCLPVVTTASRPHFRSFIINLLNDSEASALPREDIRPLGTLHLAVGGLNLKEPKRFAAAKELLHKFDIASVLEVAGRCAKDGVKFDAERYWSGYVDSFTNRHRQAASSHNDVIPLNVTVSGLSSGPVPNDKPSWNLDTFIIDRSHRLGPLWKSLYHAFQSAGFCEFETNPHARYNRKHPTQRDRRWLERMAASILPLRILGAVKGRTLVPRRRQPGKLCAPNGPKFNAQRLIEKYRNHVWINNTRLGRLSICRMGMHEAMRRGRRGLDSDLEFAEDISIPLL